MIACKDCRCWAPLEEAPGLGDCRMQPPTVIAGPDEPICAFPTTEAGCGCDAGLEREREAQP